MVGEGADGEWYLDKNNDDTMRIVGFKILTVLLCFLVRDTVSSVQR